MHTSQVLAERVVPERTSPAFAEPVESMREDEPSHHPLASQLPAVQQEPDNSAWAVEEKQPAAVFQGQRSQHPALPSWPIHVSATHRESE